MSGDGSRFLIPSAVKPQEVVFDPYLKLYRKLAASSVQPVACTAAVKQWYLDPSRCDDLKAFQAKLFGKKLPEVPGELNGVLLIGSPETTPAMRPLCEKIGFTVHGDRLTWKGTTIDLRHGSAWAVVDLKAGGRCYIALGNVRVLPTAPTAQVFLTNEIGEFIRGYREPSRTDGMAFKL